LQAGKTLPFPFQTAFFLKYGRQGVGLFPGIRRRELFFNFLKASGCALQVKAALVS
jgi:hypothetical protein